jgi:hypothetical protein
MLVGWKDRRWWRLYLGNTMLSHLVAQSPSVMPRVNQSNAKLQSHSQAIGHKVLGNIYLSEGSAGFLGRLGVAQSSDPL